VCRSYVGHLDGRPAGFMQNFKTGVKTTWKATGPVAALGAQDRALMAAEAAQKRHERALVRERMYERTAQQVDAIWTAATPVEAHPYLAEKGVPSHGLRQGVDGQTITVRDREGADHEISIVGRLGSRQELYVAVRHRRTNGQLCRGVAPSMG
jgi:phage/plasmid primase-like uncharacterized protein